MSQPRRRFIDWNRPALPAAAELLLDELADAPGDLSQLVVVVPGGRAGRRLLELLLHQPEARGVGLAPPEIITLRWLPERLYPAARPFASGLVQRLN